MDLVRALKQAFPGVRVSDRASDRAAYAGDAWTKRLIELPHSSPGLPLAVIWPRKMEEVARAVGFAREHGVTLVPFGAGSGVCGGIVPDPRSVILDTKELSSISIDKQAPLVKVGAGTLGITLEDRLEEQGYTLGHFPSSISCSTVGGWIAARGAGQCSGRYGKIEDMVAGLECVLGSGEVVELSWRQRGPNLTGLFIGSEGRLGIITGARLRLHRAPQERTFSAYTFNDVASGSNALRRIFQNGLRPAVARLYDPLDSFLLRHGGGGGTVDWQKLGAVLRSAVRIPRALNAASEMFSRSAWGRCTLLLIFEGSGDEAAADSESAHALCLSEAGRPLGEAPARAWFQHRYAISYRQALLLRSGVFSDTLEVAAPWSKIERLYRDVRRALAENALVFAHLSHAYPDGSCIYFTFCGAGRNPADASAVHQRAWRQALGAALEAGGTISHHHGIGRSKATALVEELGEGAVLTRRLMQVCDPDQIMNPGTLLPPGLSPELPRGAPAPEHPTSIPLDEPVIDSTSQLATIAGRSPLSKAEAWLQDRGFTLRLGAEAPLSASVASWIAGGVAGAPDRWSDPVDQRVAGLDGRLSSGHRVIIRPVPRRAVGPDLMALFVGAGGRIGSVESATLRVYRLREPEARPHPFHFPRNQPLGAEEASTWERIATTLSKA